MAAKKNNEKVFSLRISGELMKEVDRLSKNHMLFNINVPKSKNMWIIEAIVNRVNSENNRCAKWLVSQVQAGNSESVEKLYALNEAFINAMIKKVAPEENPKVYSIVCKEALVEAAKSFDEEKGFQFISYAAWFINKAIHKKKGL